MPKMHFLTASAASDQQGLVSLTMEVLLVFQGKKSTLWLMQMGAALPERTEVSQYLLDFVLVIQKALSLCQSTSS